MYGKIINQALVSAPNPVRLGDVVYYNPTDETYRAAGYLPVLETPCPSENTESEEGAVNLISFWEEQEGYILQVWSPAEA